MGFIVNGKKFLVTITLLMSILVLMMNERIAVSFNLIYPFLFAGSVLLIMKTFSNIEKGDIFLLSTIVVSLFFIVYMSILEVKMGLITKTVNEALLEVNDISTRVLKGVMDEKGLKDYQDFSKSLIKNYYPFLALLQFIVFGFVNLYLILKMFPDLPNNLSDPFSNISINFFGVWLINLGILLFILFHDVKIGIIGINLVLYFLAFYFFQGIATSNQFFAKFGIPLYVAVFFYIFFLANHIMWFLISLIGILDVQFDIKKRLKEA